MRAALLGLALVACSDYRIRKPDPVPPADPPGSETDVFGEPPDWATCTEAYLGQYYNLAYDDPEAVADVGDTGGEAPLLEPISLADAALWDAERAAFQRYDPTLAFGENWWPVDEGLAEDPSFFAVRWTAWLRATDSNGAEIALGASTDGWVLLDETVVASVEASPIYAPQTVALSIRSGVYPLDVRMAHRGGGDSGFRFRVVSGNVAICYPDFTGDDEG